MQAYGSSEAASENVMKNPRNLFSKSLKYLLSGLLFVSIAPSGLRADTDPIEAELIARAQAIHSDTLVLDAHADIVIPSTSHSYLGEGGVSKVSPTKLEEGGVTAVVMSVAVGPGDRTPEGTAAARAIANEKLAAVLKIVADAPDAVVLAKSADEVEAAKAAGKTALILGFQNARSLEQNVSAIDHFYDAGVRVFGLNHLRT